MVTMNKTHFNYKVEEYSKVMLSKIMYLSIILYHQWVSLPIYLFLSVCLVIDVGFTSNEYGLCGSMLSLISKPAAIVNALSIRSHDVDHSVWLI